MMGKTSSNYHPDIYPLVNIQKAIEHGPVGIVDFTIQNGGSFHSFWLTFTRPGKASWHGECLKYTIWL